MNQHQSRLWVKMIDLIDSYLDKENDNFYQIVGELEGTLDASEIDEKHLINEWYKFWSPLEMRRAVEGNNPSRGPATDELNAMKSFLLKNLDESYFCRVCGFLQDFKPWGDDGKTPAFEMCGCCGVEFGYEDCSPESVKKFREEWLKNGAKWFNPDEKPVCWSLEAQIKKIPQQFE